MSSNHNPGSLVSVMTVTEGASFAGNHWRDGLSWFLCGLGLSGVPYSEVNFGQITLGYNQEIQEFYAFWNHGPATYRVAPVERPGQALQAWASYGSEVVDALWKFVQRDTIRMFVLRVNLGTRVGYVTFRKGRRRGALHIHGDGLLSAFDSSASDEF